MHGLPASLVACDGLRAAGRPDEVDARVVEEVLRDVERRVGDHLQRVGRQPGRLAGLLRGSRSRARRSRAARADGRKMIALRVLAATIDLNSAVEVGLVIGSRPSTTPIGSATYSMSRSGSSLDDADRALVLEVVVEELGGDVVLDAPCPRRPRSRSPPSPARRGRRRARGRRRPSPRRCASTASWSRRRNARAAVRARST